MSKWASQQIHGWVRQTLAGQEYFRQRKKHHGVIQACLSEVTGLRLSQRPVPGGDRFLAAVSEVGDRTGGGPVGAGYV